MANNETELEKEDEALQTTEQIYDQLINTADATYKAQIDAAKDFEKQQIEALDQQTDFAIEEVRQNQAQAQKAYEKEQAAAYADYKKQTDPYGVNAEHMASAGLSGSGYSESSKVAMYNAMQNRVAAARESIAQITLNYNNAITEARMQNNVAKAQLAYETLVKTLELTMNGVQYTADLMLAKRESQANYLDVLNRLQTNDTKGNGTNGNGTNVLADALGSAGDWLSEKFGSFGQQNINVGVPSVDAWLNNKLYGTPYEVNMDSLNALGLQGKSVEEVYALVKKGLLKEVIKGGKITFKWAKEGAKQQALGGGVTEQKMK